MKHISSACIPAVIFLPLTIMGCNELTYDGTIANSANLSLAGCDTLATGSCNQEVFSGVVAKFVENSGSGDLTIRFVTVTDNGDGTYTYNDGQDKIVLTQTGLNTYEGTTTNASFLTTDAGLQAATFVEGTTDDILNPDLIAGVGGYQTDADVIPTSGTALYEGLSNFQLVTSGDAADGTSELYVDFGAGTADLYAYVGAGTITDFTRLESLNMTINGYTFTSGDVDLYNGGASVPLSDVTGANSDGAAAGMFFGPVDTNGNPIEFGAVAIVSGDSDKLIMYTAGDITSP